MKQVVNILEARERIQQLMQERNWSIYRLAKESGLSQTTISNIFKRNNEPSIPTLKRLCGAFGITMSQFFRGNDDGSDCTVSAEQQELINNWTLLSDTQRQLLSGLIKTMLQYIAAQFICAVRAELSNCEIGRLLRVCKTFLERKGVLRMDISRSAEKLQFFCTVFANYFRIPVLVSAHNSMLSLG